MKELSPLETLRHSASHILATAILRLYPETKLDIGPATDSGFYYDIDLDKKLTTEDLAKIEAEMYKIVKENQKFERFEVSRDEAKALIKKIGQECYKLGRLDDIPEGEKISFYKNGDFTDLCAGPHVNYTSKVKAIKLLQIAGAYHRGDEHNKQLQRIYGTAFPTKQELDDYLKQQEEAKKRDHRKLGKDLNLFVIDDTVGQGLVLWTGKGGIIRQELMNFISMHLRAQGYQQVFTPHIGKLGLYRTSGHFPYYQDSQFPPIIEREEMEHLGHEGCSCAELSNKLSKGEVDGYLLKPMNCPMHIKIFASRPHSYRDMPIRLAEFGTVYRWEQSGELNGMTRVRGFTQDDAHLFVTEDQVAQEVNGCLNLVKIVFKTLGMNSYRVRIGLRDPDSSKYVGAAESWDKAENALRDAAKGLGVPFTEEKGEAAFYGPKIDFVVKDVIGREWQLGTVQVDYNLPERFKLEYIGADNKPHRPVMIHRAPFGSLERFTGVLIEHFAGDFPTWLAPEQVRILTITDEQNAFAGKLLETLKAEGIRASLDSDSDKLGAKIRKAETDKVPWMFVVGKNEAAENCVTVRSRIAKSKEGKKTVDEAIELIKVAIATRALPEPAPEAKA
jgi:threonyl-tRNA synthetase